MELFKNPEKVKSSLSDQEGRIDEEIYKNLSTEEKEVFICYKQHKPIQVKMTHLASKNLKLTKGSILYFNFKDLLVAIPIEEFIPEIPLRSQPLYKGSTEMISPLEWSDRYLKKHLGGTYSVLVTDFTRDEKTIHITASRTKAMEIEIQAKFFSPDPYKNIRPGIKVPGIIRAIQRNSLLIETCGCEVVLPTHEIYYGLAPDLRKEFKLGQTLEVIIKSFKRNDFTQKIENLKISRKELVDDARWINIKNYQEGDLVVGEFRKAIQGGLLFLLEDDLSILIPDIDLLKQVKPGDLVQIQITRINRQTHHLYGRFCSYIEN